MAVIYTPHFIQFFGTDGAPLAGGKLYTYEAGTTTPKDTYTTAAGNVANANPVVLDSQGRAVIFLTGSYKFALTDSADVPVGPNGGITDNITSFIDAQTGDINDLSGFDIAAIAVADDYFIFQDVSDANATKRSKLGTSAAQNTGTSGATIPLLNGNNTHSGTNTFSGSNTVSGSLITTGRDYSGTITVADDAATTINFPSGASGGMVHFAGTGGIGVTFSGTASWASTAGAASAAKESAGGSDFDVNTTAGTLTGTTGTDTNCTFRMNVNSVGYFENRRGTSSTWTYKIIG